MIINTLFKSKRAIAFVLILFLCLSFFGCSNKNNNRPIIVNIPANGNHAPAQSQQPTASPVHIIPKGFILINGGTFTMGSPASELGRESDEVQHQVTLSSFYLGKYEVTQSEYQKVMETNPSQFKGDNLPVESVSWYDAIEYCNKRSQKEGLTPAYKINGKT